MPNNKKLPEELSACRAISQSSDCDGVEISTRGGRAPLV